MDHRPCGQPDCKAYRAYEQFTDAPEVIMTDAEKAKRRYSLMIAARCKGLLPLRGL